MSFNKPFRAVPIKRGARYRSKRQREKLSRFAIPLCVLLGAAALGGVAGIAPTLLPAHLASNSSSVVAYDGPLTGCTVTDGDTIRCGGERIRLLAIDAPELPGHCRRGRTCTPGDPYASSASLGAALNGDLTIDRVGEDHYGRTLARVAGVKGDLSCWQLQHGHAVYKADWDNGLRIARTCPGAVL